MIGSLTAVGDIVYAAEFDGTSTTGYTMKGGRRSSTTPAALHAGRLRRSPIYLVGYSSITALQPFKLTAAIYRCRGPLSLR